MQCLQYRVSVTKPFVEVDVDRCREERSMVAVQRQEPRSFFAENFVAGVQEGVSLGMRTDIGNNFGEDNY